MPSLSMRVANCSPIPDRNLAPMGHGSRNFIQCWGWMKWEKVPGALPEKVPGALPDSGSVLESVSVCDLSFCPNTIRQENIT